MPKIIYLILAHDCPRHLTRLVAALSSERAEFLVHIDAKSDIDMFRASLGPAAKFTAQRVAVYWGDYSQVAAIRILIREALQDPRGFDRFVLLSGTDYPVRPAWYIEDFFDRHPVTQFIDTIRMPSEAASKPLSRLTDYQPAPATTLFGKLRRRLRARLGLRARQRDYLGVFNGLVPYAGSTWWALTRSACEHIESFAQARPALVDFFRHTVCPDEMFFQTILANSAFASCTQADVTYADWSAGGASPAYLTLEHVDLLRARRIVPADAEGGARELLFARKCAGDAAAVLDALDRLACDDLPKARRAVPAH